MSIRPKTKRRLLIILSVVAILGGGMFWAQQTRQRAEAAAREGLRTTGIAAHDRGDCSLALTQLSDYLSAVKVDQHEPGDAELDALFAFADARRQLRTDDPSKYLVEARDLLERYARLRPSDDKARRLMLELNARTGRHRDTIETARQSSSPPRQPRGPVRQGAGVLPGQPKPDLSQAREAVDKLLAADPGNHNGLMLSLDLKVASGTPAEAIVEQAAKLAADHPGDPVYKLVEARRCLPLARTPAAGGSPGASRRRPGWGGRQLGWMPAGADASVSADVPAPTPATAPAVKPRVASADRPAWAERPGRRGRRRRRQAAGRPRRRRAGRQHAGDGRRVRPGRAVPPGGRRPGGRRRSGASVGPPALAGHGVRRGPFRRTASLDPKSPTADAYLLGFRGLALLARAAAVGRRGAARCLPRHPSLRHSRDDRNRSGHDGRFAGIRRRRRGAARVHRPSRIAPGC